MLMMLVCPFAKLKHWVELLDLLAGPRSGNRRERWKGYPEDADDARARCLRLINGQNLRAAKVL